jgi:hypothetical protein
MASENEEIELRVARCLCGPHGHLVFDLIYGATPVGDKGVLALLRFLIALPAGKGNRPISRQCEVCGAPYAGFVYDVVTLSYASPAEVPQELLEQCDNQQMLLEEVRLLFQEKLGPTIQAMRGPFREGKN